MIVDNYPLYWPTGINRTQRPQRNYRFKCNFVSAREELFIELKRLAGKNCNPILSTNLETRLDGLPYANKAEPKDAGVAVWFTYKNNQHCMTCDMWDRVKDNMHSITLAIRGLRQVERHGGGQMLEQAFMGFKALESGTDWAAVLEVPRSATKEEIKQAYRLKTKTMHPDCGGSVEEFNKLSKAYETALAAC